MAVRWSSSFGVCDTAGAVLYFDQFTGNPIYDDIVPAPPGPGAGGATEAWFNSPKPVIVRDAQSSWFLNFNFQPFFFIPGNPVWGRNKFIQFADASGNNIIAVEIEPNGKLSLITGGTGGPNTGITIAATTQVFALGVWSGPMELVMTGFGGMATISLYENDVLLVTVTTSIPFTPDRVTIYSDGGDGSAGGQPFSGLRFANGVLTDGAGPAPWNSRLGPVRVTPLSPNADISGQWPITPSTILNVWQAVNDLYPADGSGSPDRDHSFVGPLLTNTQYLQFQKAACYGRILGVNMTCCFRGTSGTAALQCYLLQPPVAPLSLGLMIVNGAGYLYKQLFQGLSLASGTYFTDAELAGASWGFSTTGPDVRVTQVLLEKIVSLRSTPFDCGQSSYSF